MPPLDQTLAAPPRSAPLRWLERLAAAALLAAGVLIGGAFVPRAPLPLDGVQRARALLYEARIVAAGRSSTELARAEAAVRRLEKHLAEEATVRWRPRRSDEIAALARDAETAARMALSALRAERAAQRSEQADRRREIERRFADLSRLATTGRELRSAMRAAEIDLATARVAEARGDLAALRRSLDSAAMALEELDDHLARRAAHMDDPTARSRWQAWVDQAVADTAPGGTAIVVDKGRRRAFLVVDGAVARAFRIELGRSATRRKLWEGDGATPEGRYRVTAKKDVGQSRYHRALLFDYPNDDDRDALARAARDGRAPRGRGPGGLIEIHGKGGRGFDWTDGCIALTDADMDRLFDESAVGTPIVIVPTAVLRALGGSR